MPRRFVAILVYIRRSTYPVGRSALFILVDSMSVRSNACWIVHRFGRTKFKKRLCIILLYLPGFETRLHYPEIIDTGPLDRSRSTLRKATLTKSVKSFTSQPRHFTTLNPLGVYPQVLGKAKRLSGGRVLVRYHYHNINIVIIAVFTRETPTRRPIDSGHFPVLPPPHSPVVVRSLAVRIPSACREYTSPE